LNALNPSHNQNQNPQGPTYAFPLSFAQQRLWVIAQMGNVGSTFNIYGAFNASGALNLAVFKEAIQYLVNRHESFRTTFDLIDGKPVQVIHPSLNADVEFEIINPGEATDAWIKASCERESSFIFDLKSGPLFRVKVIQCSVDQHVISFCFHHIISDGWSVAVFANELQVVYDALLQNIAVPLQELPLQYADYAIWQREWFEAGNMQHQIDFWSTYLAEAPESIDLVFDKTRKPVQSFAGNIVSFNISSIQSQALKGIADEAGATLFMALMAVFGILLSKYTLQKDILIGSVVANRNRREWEAMIGFLVNVVVLRLKPDPGMSFLDFLKEVKADSIRIYDNQDVPFEKVLDELKVPRDASHNPLFQVMFTLQSETTNSPEFAGLEFTPIEIANKTTKYDLTLGITVTKDGLNTVFQYNTDLFEQTTIELMAHHFSTLIQQITAAPDKDISTFSLLSPLEQDRMLEGLYAGVSPVPSLRVPSMISRMALADPLSVALVHGTDVLNYGELHEQSSLLAGYLRDTVGRGSVVAVCMDRCPLMVVSFLAILKAGCSYLAIDTLHPLARKQFMLEDSGAVLLLSGMGGVEMPGVVPSVNVKELDLSAYAVAEEETILSSDAAYVVYTSGSTGQPKGVSIHHGGLENLVHWHKTSFGLSALDQCTQVAGISFDASVWEIWPVLCAGATLHIQDRELLLDPLALQAEVLEKGITVCFWPTPLAELMLGLEWPEEASLRYLLIGGDKLRRRPSTRLPFEVIDNYGLAESCVVSTSTVGCAPGLETIGRPISNSFVLVLDEQLQLQPAGVRGELYITGEGLVLNGYLNRPELTAERFVANPFRALPYSRLYRTGDTGSYTANGELRYFGRTDRQVKIRGHRIEPAEVEEGILAVPGVTTCAVIVKQTTDGANQLAAFVVTDKTPGEVREALQLLVPPSMIPAVIVNLAQLPLTNNGKIDYKFLQKQVIEKPVELGVPQQFSKVEETLISLWEEVLGVNPISIDENFFELGGDSINTIQVAAKARQKMLSLTSKDIFLYQTIRELATRVKTETIVNEQQELDNKPFPLHPIQAWFFEQNAPDLNHFNHSVAVDIPWETNSDTIKAAFYQLAELHDILKIRFYSEDGKISQCYDNKRWKENFAVYDLTNCTVDEVQIQQKEAIEKQGLDVFGGKLFSVIFFEGGPERGNKLVFIFHHLIIDSFSWLILLGDLYALSTRLAGSVETDKLPKSRSYKSYIGYLNQFVLSDSYAQSIAYWKINKAKNHLHLPIDMPHRKNTYGQALRIDHKFSSITSQKIIKDLQRVYGTGVQTILVAALAKTFSEWTGRQEVAITMESLGRHEGDFEVDVSRTVGWFTALYPLYVDISPSEWPDVIRTVKEKMNEEAVNGAFFGVGKYLGNDEDLRSLPYPQISFNYHGNVGRKTDTGRWKVAADDLGAQISSSFPRQHLLDVNAAIENGQLSVSFSYNPDIHHGQTIQALSAKFSAYMEDIVRLYAQSAHVFYSPSDFPFARINQQGIDRITTSAGYAINIYGLAPMQSGLLFHSVYSGANSNAYFVQMSLLLEGKLDSVALNHAWNTTVNNHDALKSMFIWKGLQEPVQVVCNNVDVPWQYTDSSHLSGADAETYLTQQQREHETEGFSLHRAPLMRLHLIKTAEHKHILIWSYHHLIIDGWSMAIVLKEVFGRYTAIKSGKTADFFRPPSFSKYMEWIAKQNASAAVAFWRTQLSSISETVAFEQDLAGKPEDKFVYGEERITFKKDEFECIDALLKRHKVTLNTLFQGLWSLIIRSYTGQDQAVFGITISGRPPEIDGIEKMVGLFINTIPVNIVIDAEEEFFSWINRIQLQHAAREEYGYLPLAEIQKLRDAGAKSALFDSLLIIENYPSVTANSENLTDLNISMERSYERIEMPICVIISSNSDLNLKISYDAGRFSQNFINGLLGHFKHALTCLLQDNSPKVKEVNLLGADDINHLVFKLNDTEQLIPSLTVIDLLEQQVAEVPLNTAVSDAYETLNYIELSKRVDVMAAYIFTANSDKRPVAVMMERSVNMVATLLAVMKAGCPYIPLDPSFPKERISQMLTHGKPGLLIKDTLSIDEHQVSEIRVLSSDDLFSIDPQEYKTSFPTLTDLDSAYIIYTSGSTGKPKGVEIPHGALSNFLMSFKNQLDFNAQHRLLALTTISFDIAALEMYLPLISGGHVFISPTLSSRDPTLLTEAINTFKPHFIQGTPATFSMMAEAGWFGCATVSLLIGGEALPVQLALSLLRNSKEVYNLYGPTETTIWSSCHKLQKQISYSGNYITIGKPISNTEFYVLNSDRQLVPFGQPGELYIGGKGLAKGYYHNSAETSSRFIDHVFENGQQVRLYRTGDMVRYLPDGNLAYINRIDNQVKIRGFRIELGDIEAAITQYPGVLQAVCFVKKEEISSFEEIVGLIILEESKIVRMEGLREHLRAFLPYYMVPSILHSTRKFPYTPNGKIDRKALASIELTHDGVANTKITIASRTLTELKLVNLWEQVLEHENIGVTEDFFDLGGHSLLAVKLVSQIQLQFGGHCTIAQLMQNSTVERLAAVLEKGLEMWDEQLISLKPEGDKAPILLLPGEGGSIIYYKSLVKYLDPGHPVYGLQFPGLDGLSQVLESVEALAELFVEIIQREFSGLPVVLVGHSFGGQVAFELACRLLQKNHLVEQLIILDTVAPLKIRSNTTEMTTAAWLSKTVNRIASITKTSFSVSEEQLAAMDHEQQQQEVKKVLTKANLIPAYFDNKRMMGFLQVLRANQGMNYLPSLKQKINIQLLKASDNQHYMDQFSLDERIVSLLAEQDYGWQHFTFGEVAVKLVPGDHESILTEPSVPMLAREINRLLLT